MKITTAEQMREIDRISIEERGMPSLTLMENAGMVVSHFVLRRIAPKHAAVVTGKGNNAGDGFVAARHLYNAGIKVTLLMLAGEKELSGDAEINYSALPPEIPRYLCTRGSQIAMNLEEADCVIDAILGTGARGEVKDLYREAIEAINQSQTSVVAVDIPSGLPADAEYFDGLCIHADYTITMGLPKIGMMQYPAAGFCGEIIAAPIGHPEDLLMESCESRTHLITKSLAREILPYRPAEGHKGTFGSVLVVAGSTGMTGAAALSSQSAARSGAGLVFLAIPQSLNPILEIKITEPITIPLPTKYDGIPDTGMLGGILEKSSSMNAIALGPGMGRTEGTRNLIREIYARTTIPLILDADGITAFHGAAHLLGERKAPAILTPHPGEMSGLIGIPASEIQKKRISIAREFAMSHGVFLVLKGARTVIAAPSGDVYINITGNTALSKGGSGDVLTGLIAGLLAQKVEPLFAAILGVYIHGVAGEKAAAAKTERAALPSDVLDAVSSAFKDIEAE